MTLHANLVAQRKTAEYRFGSGYLIKTSVRHIFSIKSMEYLPVSLSLDKGKPVPQASFFNHFFEDGHNGSFRVGNKIIDGADDVFSLRRKELFWQYRLQTFSPKGLNERAADVDM